MSKLYGTFGMLERIKNTPLFINEENALFCHKCITSENEKQQKGHFSLIKKMHHFVKEKCRLTKN